MAERIIIFGAGNCGMLIANSIVGECDLVCFIDNDQTKNGKIIEIDNFVGGGGIPVYNPQKLNLLSFDKVILGTFTGLEELKQQLQEDFAIPPHKIDSSYIENSVLSRIAFLRDFASMCYDFNITGNVAEVGVYRGDFAKYINQYFKDKKLYLFDTFSGFSKEDIKDEWSKKLGSTHFSNTSVELVLSKMPHKELCIIKKGYFPDTASDLEQEEFCFVNLDTDLYDPILAGLHFFYPKLVKHGVILVHEYFSKGYIGVKKAVDEFLDKNQDACFMPIGDSLSIAILKK